MHDPRKHEDRGHLRVGILFGGVSTEHEVSIASATTIFNGLDPDRHIPVLIGLAHDQSFWIAEPEAELEPGTLFEGAGAVRAFPSLREGLEFLQDGGKSTLSAPLDVVFPIIHGRGGEDGILQGVLEMAGVPYVGAGVAASALCMDKTLSKRVLRDAGVPVVPSVEHPRETVLRDPEAVLRRVEEHFPYPVFVKPTNTGSSVGVSKARTRGELGMCLKQAARFDHDVLVEPGLDVREIECAVLGGHAPEASVLGEILPAVEFYDYAAKYQSEATQLMIPASLPDGLSDEIRALALLAFRATKCFGMARVDFFVERGTDRVLLNELNTLPGFTSGSMYPLLWQASGLELRRLVDRLIDLALERHHEARQLVVRYEP